MGNERSINKKLFSPAGDERKKQKCRLRLLKPTFFDAKNYPLVGMRDKTMYGGSQL